MRIFGCFSHTPPQITARQASIISIVWRDDVPRRALEAVHADLGMPREPPSWKPIAMSSSSAAVQNGSYIGSLIILLLYGLGRRKHALEAQLLAGEFHLLDRVLTDCIGIIAMPNRRSG